MFGIFHMPSEFVNLAINLEHPFDVFTGVPDVVAVNLFNLLVEGPLVIAARRLRKIREWKALAVDLDGDEKAFKQTLHPEVAQVLAGKRILLLKRLASDISWPDMAVFDELAKGFKLVGMQAPTGVFAKDVKLQGRLCKTCHLGQD